MRNEEASTRANSVESVEEFEMQPMHHADQEDPQRPPPGFVDIDLSYEHDQQEVIASANRTSQRGTVLEAISLLGGGNNCEVM